MAEIVGAEGLQDADRLLMATTERIRNDFLRQSAYGADAFSSPLETAAKIGGLLAAYDSAATRLGEGVPLDELLKG